MISVSVDSHFGTFLLFYFLNFFLSFDCEQNFLDDNLSTLFEAYAEEVFS